MYTTLKQFLKENNEYKRYDQPSDYDKKVHSEYLKWKRNNVTIRGVKEQGQENDAGAMLGSGLYTAYLSNKELAKKYGKVYFVVGGVPEHPKTFNDLNQWEIWYYNVLITKYCKENDCSVSKRKFNEITTIEDAMQELGYDGICIKGREMVNFKPKDVKYFGTEEELKNYFRFEVRK